MAEYEQAVFISYAWGEEREAIVNEIDETLQQRGIRIIRDKRALGYKGSIKEFMERIGRGSCIIVVISDKYLRSPNCMFELVEIAENRQFHDRVFPIVLSDANIYDPLKRIEYVKHWEGKRKELAKAMKTLDPANLHGIREEMDQYDRIRDKISGITSILKDMNTLTPDMHRDSEFSNLYDAIVERLREGAGDSTAEQDRLAAQKAEEERLTKAEADRLAAQKMEEDHRVKEKVVPVETKAEPVVVAPAQKKPVSKGLVIGIAAVVVLCIAGIGIGFSLLSNPGTTATEPPVAFNPATEAPAALVQSTAVRVATSTARIPTPTSSVSGPMLLNTSEAEKIIENDEAQSIFSIAREQNTEDEWNSFLDNSQPIPVTLTNPGPIYRKHGWCATTREILEDNLASIKITFKFDNKVVPESKLVEQYSTADDGLECFSKFIVIDNWIAGEYTIHSEMSITQAINDGLDDYEPHTTEYDFIVTVQ